MTQTIAHDTVSRAVRAAMARAAPMSVSAWAAAHRRIVAQEAAEPGPWRNERTPYLRGIMDAFNDPRVNRLSVMKAERVGGSEAVLNILGYIIDRAPGPVLYIYPSEDVAFEVNRKRILPTIKKTPALLAHMTGRAWDARLLDVQLDRMSIAFRGSNSEGKLEALGFKYVIKDELDRMAPNTADIVRGRGAANPGMKDIDVSTPELEWSGDPEDRTQGIDRSFKQGDRRRLYVPCPHCGGYHQRTFKRVKWIGDLEAAPDYVEESAYFICPCLRADGSACEGIIHGHHNQQQLAECAWVPEGWGILRGGIVVSPTGERFEAAGGVYFPTGSSHASFAIHGLYTPFKANPYGYLAREFVSNRGHTTREWLNRRMGEPWSLKGQRVEASRLGILCGYVRTGLGSDGSVGSDGSRVSGLGSDAAHPKPGNPNPETRSPQWHMGTVPSECQALTGFADVQADRMYLEVVGWNFAGGVERCWLVDRLAIGRVVQDGLRELNDYAWMARWPVLEMGTGAAKGHMGLSILGVDSGFYTDEVYDFCRPRQRGRWWDHKGKRLGAEVYATKGEFFPAGGGGASAAAPSKWTYPEDKEPHIGAANPHRDRGIMLLHINTGFFKRLHFDTLRAEINAAEAMREEGVQVSRCRGVKGPDSHLTPHTSTPSSASRRWFFPIDTGRDYFDQITAEQEVAKQKPDGRVVTVWSKIPGQRDNHFLDCRVGNLAMVRAANVAERVRAVGGKK